VCHCTLRVCFVLIPSIPEKLASVTRKFHLHEDLHIDGKVFTRELIPIMTVEPARVRPN